MSEASTGELVSKLQQDDLRLLLMSDDLFNNITVLTEDDGDIESQMSKALGVFGDKDGAHGVAVVIQQPTGADEFGGVRFGPLKLNWTFLVLEQRTLNKDTSTGGTGKKAWTVARRIHRILKHHKPGGLMVGLVPSQPGVVPVTGFALEVNGRMMPLVAYEVRFEGLEGDFQVYTRVNNPTISGASISTETGVPVGTVGDTITLACGTSGADIYYTTDLTHPCSQNTTATLYSAPFVATSGTLRVRAHKSGSVGSDTVAAQFN